VLTLVHSADVVEAAPATAERPSPIRTALVPGTLLDFLRDRTTGLVAQAGPTPVADLDDLHDADVDVDEDEELMDRLQDMYRSALPERLSAISEHTSAGDASAVASAAITLAGTSGQLGHPEVASICRAIAADARRGVLAHSRVQELQALAGA
jgi:HPt (histidine-containing phosphotransfer) domain-containing protein